MNLEYYEKEVEKILPSLQKENDVYNEYELSDIIDIIAKTISMYDDEKTKILKGIVRFILLRRFNIRYTVCDDEEISSYQDLIVKDYDYPHSEYKEDEYLKKRQIVEDIKKIPQFEQKSAEWLAQRNECLTATAVATAIDEDPYNDPIKCIYDKCGLSPPFEENENVHHGKKYEQIANMYYCFRNNIVVDEFGLLTHPTKKYIAASPDGICGHTRYDKEGLSRLVGRLLEIKCPKKRKIRKTGELNGEICPHYYWVQCQVQMFVTGLDECDFLQCEIGEYPDYETMWEDSKKNCPGLSKETGLEKGCVIQLLPKRLITDDKNQCLWHALYLYPPRLHMTRKETDEWILNETINFHKHKLSENFVFDKVICWKFTTIACNLIKADKEWMKSQIPILKQFWSYIKFYRDNRDKLNSLQKYVEKVGVNQTAKIFKRIHEDYSEEYESDAEPLHQTENKWRKEYNEKKKKWQKK